jgi:hypothetical protein
VCYSGQEVVEQQRQVSAGADSLHVVSVGQYPTSAYVLTHGHL